jgi:hypothetical protein
MSLLGASKTLGDSGVQSAQLLNSGNLNLPLFSPIAWEALLSMAE